MTESAPDVSAKAMPDVASPVHAVLAAWGQLLAPVAAVNRDSVDPRDKRFAGPEWDHPVFDLMRQGYAVMSKTLMDSVEAMPVDAAQKARMAFAMRTVVEAM